MRYYSLGPSDRSCSRGYGGGVWPPEGPQVSAHHTCWTPELLGVGAPTPASPPGSLRPSTELVQVLVLALCGWLPLFPQQRGHPPLLSILRSLQPLLWSLLLASPRSFVKNDRKKKKSSGSRGGDVAVGESPGGSGLLFSEKRGVGGGEPPDLSWFSNSTVRPLFLLASSAFCPRGHLLWVPLERCLPDRPWVLWKPLLLPQSKLANQCSSSSFLIVSWPISVALLPPPERAGQSTCQGKTPAPPLPARCSLLTSALLFKYLPIVRCVGFD